MKKKNQIDRAIESLEAELSASHRVYATEAGVLQARYQGRVEALESSIKSLRAQAARITRRRTPKPSAAPDSAG